MTSGFSGIRVQIVEADGLTYPADALVLKRAQALYGLDAQVVARAGIPDALLPPPDGFRIVRDPDGVAADALMFIGVGSIREFTYTDIRRFGFRALCSIASELAQATEIALTLHGVGYGLDEVECFDAEIAGSIPGGRHGCASDSHSSRRRRPQTPDRPRWAICRRSAPCDRPAWTRSDRVHSSQCHSTSRSPTCSIYGISSAVRANGLLCERIDQQSFTGGTSCND